MISLPVLSRTVLRLSLLVFCSTAAIGAELTQEQVAAAKQATGLLISANGSGTAFCVSDTGLFITANHIVAAAKKESLAIVIDPAGKNEKKYPVRVLRRVPDTDLAVVKADLDRKMTVLKLGDDDGLFETQPLFAFGYPFGTALATDAKSYPSISVNFGRVTSLRKKGNVLEAIQLDAQLNPGNSGGPVLDDRGNVVGIVSSGVVASGVNFATPVSLLKKAIDAPMISVEAPSVKFEKRFDPAEFVIAADWIMPPTVEPVVSIEVTSEGQSRRATAAKGNDGKYRVSIAPLMPKATNTKAKLQITVDFASGRVSGSIDDFPVAIAGKPKPLAEIRTIEHAMADGPYTVDGSANSALPELAELTIDVGGMMLKVDGQKAKRIEISPPSQDLETISYNAVVAAGSSGAVLASNKGTISVGSAPAAVATPSKLQGGAVISEMRSIALPSAADDVVSAGDGRLLIFHLKDVKKLAIFDVIDLKIRGYVSLDEEPALFAGGSRHLVVAYPTKNIIQRFSLQTFEREKTANSPFEQMTGLVMGYQSPRWALFVAGGGTVFDPGFRMFDVDKMEAGASSKDDNQFSQLGAGSGRNFVVRASGDGRTYGVFRPMISPTGFSVVSFRNNQLSLFYEHVSPGVLVPNADGSMIFSGQQGVYTPRYVSILSMNGNWHEGTSLLPSYHPMYFFAVPYGERSSSGKKTPPRTIAIYAGRSNQPLVNLPDAFEEMQEKSSTGSSRSDKDPITMDKRYHFYPQLNLFLTIPPTNDKIVARPIDVRKVLSDKGIDYLYVTSVPPAVRTSEAVQFRLEAASKAGGVTYSLQSGPSGLKISTNGTVDWVAPSKVGEETVIVALKDALGNEVLHTFQIVITN